MNVEFPVKNFIFMFLIWGIICFIAGYALNGQIWNMLTWIWHGLGF